MGMRVDHARQDDTAAQTHDVGSRSNEGFHVRIAAHEDDGITADRKRLNYLVVRIYCVNPTVEQDEIGRWLCWPHGGRTGKVRQ